MKGSTIFVKIIIIVFVIMGLTTLYILTEDYIESKENSDLTKEVIEESIEVNKETNEIETIDWTYLKNINSDIIGWIKIENSDINYPILKDSSEGFYLKHAFDKTYNKNGAIFTLDNEPFLDKETTIHGHNMRNGTMFSKLDNYMDKDYFYSHLKLEIFTPTAKYEGVIFSVYSIGVETEYNNIKELEDLDRVNYYKNASKYKVEMSSKIDKLVKLSTCSYLNAKTRPTDQRYYIIASIKEI